MAYPKALKEIAERLARIEAHLGIKDDEYEVELPQPPGATPAAAATDIGDEGDEAGDLSAYDLTDAQLAALQEAGFHTTADIAAASDDDLMDVDGIGKATVRKLRS